MNKSVTSRSNAAAAKHTFIASIGISEAYGGKEVTIVILLFSSGKMLLNISLMELNQSMALLIGVNQLSEARNSIAGQARHIVSVCA